MVNTPYYYFQDLNSQQTGHFDSLALGLDTHLDHN